MKHTKNTGSVAANALMLLETLRAFKVDEVPILRGNIIIEEDFVSGIWIELGVG